MLEVKDLSFTYTGTAHEALRGINLTIPIGCRAAVVGENGSGKSTLVKLLTLLYKPNKGEIHWIDGLGNKVGGTSVRNQMSAVFQDFAPLYLTVRENVALGKYTAFTDDNALHKSLILSGIGKKLRDLDLQLGAVFGGPEPSGGEWQKIVTARAIVRDAAFVFFDEPTAALDPQAEKEAFELFLKVTEGRSALLVTHRLGAARLADLIFVMKDGCLIEQGTHDELMQLNGEYGTMFRMQAEWYQ
ncbi:MAG: Xenobiotic-transporting ATPase [Paenibacillus sp.]|nr:Xenobiotic-transporting ATPase [Paenibacillus sp.]